MRRNPPDWRIADFEVLALRYGLKVRKQAFVALLDDIGA